MCKEVNVEKFVIPYGMISSFLFRVQLFGKDLDFYALRCVAIE